MKNTAPLLHTLGILSVVSGSLAHAESQPPEFILDSSSINRSYVWKEVIFNTFDTPYDAQDSSSVITLSGNSSTILSGGHGYSAVSVDGAPQPYDMAGDSALHIKSNTVSYIGGASRLTHDVASRFDGSTDITVYTRQSGSASGSADFDVSDKVIAGGFLGLVYLDTTGDGVQRDNTITGSTRVTVDFTDKTLAYGASSSREYDSIILGGSLLAGVVDSRIEGGSHVAITNASDAIFVNYVIGGDYNLSRYRTSILGRFERNDGIHGSDSYNASTSLKIDSGTFRQTVIAGSMTAGGGDVVSGKSTLEVTGGSFEQYLVAGHIAGDTNFGGNVRDSSVGALIMGDVEVRLSGAQFQYLNVADGTVWDNDDLINPGDVIKTRFVGGHYMGGWATSNDTTLASSIGNINITLGGYDASGTPLAGNYLDIYGGSANISRAARHIAQGAVTINMISGHSLDYSHIHAAGTTDNGGTITTEGTQIKIGRDYLFGDNTRVYGGFENLSESHPEAGVVTGEKLLSFEDAAYNAENVAGTTFYDFDRVNVSQSSATATLQGDTTLTTLDATELSKTGAGSAIIEAGSGSQLVRVEQGSMQINTTRLGQGDVEQLDISTGATARTQALTIAESTTADTGLTVRTASGDGRLIAETIEVRDAWTSDQLDVEAAQTFTMLSGEDVRLESLETRELQMTDQSQLNLSELLQVSRISITELHESDSTARSPYITAKDMLTQDTESFTFDFSSESIANMLLDTSTPYLLADLDEEFASASAEGKSFVFQIDGVGDIDIQAIGDTLYYIDAAEGGDIYIYALPSFVQIPEPSTATLSLLALSAFVGRRRRSLSKS